MEDIDFIVGTFGKAFASMGAFVVCSSLFCEYLINTQRSLIFTTALPPVNVAWTRIVLNHITYGMCFVHIQESAELLFHLAKFQQIGSIAVHAENRFCNNKNTCITKKLP